ncbi:hypothetical protein BYT27DRAFT_7284310, partial [Phlegmacium glaucopus]
MVLRSISLFDGQFTQDAFMKNFTQNTGAAEKVKNVLKRKVGYTEEEVSMTRAKLTEMDIDKEMDCEE